MSSMYFTAHFFFAIVFLICYFFPLQEWGVNDKYFARDCWRLNVSQSFLLWWIVFFLTQADRASGYDTTIKQARLCHHEAFLGKHGCIRSGRNTWQSLIKYTKPAELKFLHHVRGIKLWVYKIFWVVRCENLASHWIICGSVTSSCSKYSNLQKKIWEN